MNLIDDLVLSKLTFNLTGQHVLVKSYTVILYNYIRGLMACVKFKNLNNITIRHNWIKLV